MKSSYVPLAPAEPFVESTDPAQAVADSHARASGCPFGAIHLGGSVFKNKEQALDGCYIPWGAPFRVLNGEVVPA